MTNFPSHSVHGSIDRNATYGAGLGHFGSSALRLASLGAAIAASTLLSACGGRGAKPVIFLDQATGQVGTGNTKPGSADQYIVDEHGGGAEQRLRMEQLYWGRLVDVYDFDGLTSETRLIYRDFVVGEDVRSELGKWNVDTNVITGQTFLTILARNSTTQDASGVQQKDAFDLLLEEAESTVTQIEFREPSQLGGQTRIARNCAIVVQFNDLLDESTILLNDTVKVLTGNPPTVPYDARLFADTNHGGLDPDSGEFKTTRIVIDTTIDEFEGIASIPLNSLGLPGSSSLLQANVALLFPTVVSQSNGQFHRLTNLRGRPLDAEGNLPVTSGPTQDVVRSMRTGTSTESSNGFLVDLVPPSIIGSQPVFIPPGSITRPAGADQVGDADYGYLFDIDVAYLVISCATSSKTSHVIQVSNQGVLTVLEEAPVVAGSIAALRVRWQGDEPAEPADLAGSALYFIDWRPEYAGAGQAPCFLTFSPSAGTAPATNVPNDAQISIRFSEAMDPASFTAFDTFRVTRNATATNMYQYVIGEIGIAPDLREYRFLPVAPFSNQVPVTPNDSNPLDYFFTLTSDATLGGLRDLAGNLLSEVPPTVTFTVSNQSPVRNAGYVFRYAGSNLDENGDGNPDTRGQFTLDTAQGRLLPRQASRFARTIDITQPAVNIMLIPAVPGVQTPLSNLGSRLHHMWRYEDMGLEISRTDGSFNDLDAEFSYLAPVGGQIVAAFYPEYSLGMAHSNNHTDPILDNATGFPEFANSGFKSGATFADTYLTVQGSTPFAMHSKEKGFVVAGSELATSESGTSLLRLPLNKGLDAADRSTFTWRDTTVTTRGQLSPGGLTIGPGVPTKEEVKNLMFPSCWGSVWGGGNDNGIPTVGLPLLLEHRTYPTETLALINFQIRISNGSSKDPSHRAFSTGGYNTVGTAVPKNPDLQTSPTGGFNGLTGAGLPPLGATTPGLDNTVYFGQVDFVVRYSRAFTIPVDASGQADPTYIRLIVEPTAVDQPLGTSVVLAYRGHDTVIGGASRILNATNIDVYGEEAPPAPGLTTNCTGETVANANFNGFVFNAPIWRTSLQSQQSNRYVQYRITFVNNTDSELSPTLTSLGVAYTF